MFCRDSHACSKLSGNTARKAEVHHRDARDTERVSRTRLPGAAVASLNLLASPTAKPSAFYSVPSLRLCGESFFPLDGYACLRINCNITLAGKRLLQIPCRNR